MQAQNWFVSLEVFENIQKIIKNTDDKKTNIGGGQETGNSFGVIHDNDPHLLNCYHHSFPWHISAGSSHFFTISNPHNVHTTSDTYHWSYIKMEQQGLTQWFITERSHSNIKQRN